jgi:polyphosphate kinase 2
MEAPMSDNLNHDAFGDLFDSLEFVDEPRVLQGAAPVDPSRLDDVDERRRYFLESLYPYGERMSVKAYYLQKRELQIELVKLQNWIKDSGERLLIVFEGRDAAGKGSTIKRFMEYLNPRGARVVALEKPSEEEQSQWYFQRYVRHFPSAGEIVFFDRSWYNRAGVERVMGFCSDDDYERFMVQAPQFERMIVESGIRLQKLYFSVGAQTQERRFRERETNPLKRWKLSPIDREAQKRWEDYTAAKEAIFRRTDLPESPWWLIKSDDKMRTRLEAMRTVLHQIPYEGRDDAAGLTPDPWLVSPASEIYGRDAAVAGPHAVRDRASSPEGPDRE